MASASSPAPLWLDIKTEYIDENFEKVLDYLHKGSIADAVRDSFYNTTLELLSKRVGVLLESIAARPVYEDEEIATDKEYKAFCTRLLATYLLVGIADEDRHIQRCQATMLSCLSGLVPPEYSQNLIELALKVLLGRVGDKLAFSWADITTFQPQILAHKIVTTTQVSDGGSTSLSYANKGVLNIEKGILTLAAASREKLATANLAASLNLFDGQIQILTAKGDKVKKSESANLEKLNEFTRDFVSAQRGISLLNASGTLPKYSDGDRFRAVITDYGADTIKIKSIDPKYAPVESTIKFDSTLFYDFLDFRKNIATGEEIPVELTNAEKGECSVSDEFVRYIIDEVADGDFGKEVLAKCLEEMTNKKGKKKYVWITDGGYPAFSNSVDDARPGDFAYIKIIDHGKDQYYGYITAEFIEKTEDTFDYDGTRAETMRNFSYGPVQVSKPVYNDISNGAIKELYRMLVSYQHNLGKPSERYQILCVARMLAELIGNSADSNYINFISDYLEDLVLFAKGEIGKMQNPVPDIEVADLESVRRRMNIVKILKAYGDESYGDELDEMILSTKDPLLKKIAILVQSCNRINDVISKSMQNVIKREIVKSLSIETEGETDLEEENGTYLGIENSRQEFKTSFFYAPANAKEQNQKITIFKGVCAFLNSQAGGTLFLGVDDLGYVKGISEDIEYMENTVYGNYHDVDGYIRYITDEAKKYFDLGVLTHIRIEPMYENQVIALNVTPYEYKVVELEGVAYIRLNNETVVMNEATKRQILDRRISSSREKAANVSAILESIRDKRKVIFHNYCSSNSGEIQDRNMEPFAFSTGYTHVWCYDLDKERNSVFHTERIGNVEILDEPWENESLHKQGRMDAFHMTGDKPIHVVLQLDLMARNLLCEEYPDVRSNIVPTENPNRWILDINVFRIQGIGRFYLGLAGNIEIISCPELQDYVREYTEKYLA